MQFASFTALVALASAALASNSANHVHHHRAHKAGIIQAQRDFASNVTLDARGHHGYKLVSSHHGETFFQRMQFFTGNDPSKGNVDYVGHDTAHHHGLIGMKDGHAMMRVAPHHSGNHKSVRPSTEMSFTTGLFILDAYHMPTGCGTWPAFFTVPVDSNWPDGGEIDVIEGISNSNRNKYSIHTSAGCSVKPSLMDMKLSDLTGQRNCDARKTNDEGCAISSQADGDYGTAYNQGNGGVHVLEWDEDDGISIYFFPRDKIPQDIEDGKPNPKNWGTPRANWPTQHCSPLRHFFAHHVAVFTNTLCGTWAGNHAVWHNKGAGADESCAAKTGHDSCESWLRSGKADLTHAYWQIKSLKIYQKHRQH